MRECQQDIPFRDFDGSWNSHVCGDRATRRLVIYTDEARAHIEFLGGWENFREMEVGIGGKTADPGPDPGPEHWGEDTVYLCDEHVQAWRAADGDDLSVLSDEAVCSDE